ncbi:hypothetical protein [uncultured Sphingomonas sp.]|uniref:hypothetical protein n=1 Tax=uncultured Sphingomonas sp. TaxID=158754 RepID=UPI0025880B9A|nr:hypothetical protein [uncultured Sphingomonas sp.]
MGSWRDVAAAVVQRREQPAVMPPVADTFGLPEHLAASLRTLEYMPAPRRGDLADRWRGIVRDALGLARGGWAANAMALNWSAGDLFGIGPRDDWEFSGLAVWLRGRSIVLLDQQRAIVADGDQRAAFTRGGMGHGKHPTVTPVMLWEFGR